MSRDQIIKTAISKAEKEDFIFIENGIVFSKKRGLPPKKIATIFKPTKV